MRTSDMRLTIDDLDRLKREAAEHGLILTTRCRHCGAALTRDESILDRSGPVCTRRHEETPAGATAAKHSTDEGQQYTDQTPSKETER
ncbi:hypothetical protein [Brevibacterium litoralis]|uniref:hypothetical protein n=1 Tax=Brevibacterium litoralis TaxID=3138935 RepID=UPI0032EF06A1